MVIANQRSSSVDFVLFPFTHPTTRWNFGTHGSSERRVPPLASITTHKDNLHVNHHVRRQHPASPMVKSIAERVRDLDAAYGSPEPQTVKGQKFRFTDGEDDRRGDVSVHDCSDDFAEDWEHEDVAEFLASEQERLNSAGDYDNDEGFVSPGRDSLLVQVGQSDAYETEMEKYARIDTLDESHDGSAFGPALPAVHPNEAHKEELERGVETAILELEPPAFEGRILMMVTNMGMNRTQVQNQLRANMLLNALSIPFESIDGSNPANKDVRNELFKLSDMRGIYPQFFVVSEGGGGVPQTTFLGDWETIEGINDSSSLPAELLAANPTLLTWDRIPGLVFRKMRDGGR